VNLQQRVLLRNLRLSGITGFPFKHCDDNNAPYNGGEDKELSIQETEAEVFIFQGRSEGI